MDDSFAGTPLIQISDAQRSVGISKCTLFPSSGGDTEPVGGVLERVREVPAHPEACRGRPHRCSGREGDRLVGLQSGWAGPGSLSSARTLAAPITTTRPRAAKEDDQPASSGLPRARKVGKHPPRWWIRERSPGRPFVPQVRDHRVAQLVAIGVPRPGGVVPARCRLIEQVSAADNVVEQVFAGLDAATNRTWARGSRAHARPGFFDHLFVRARRGPAQKASSHSYRRRYSLGRRPRCTSPCTGRPGPDPSGDCRFPFENKVVDAGALLPRRSLVERVQAAASSRVRQRPLPCRLADVLAVSAALEERAPDTDGEGEVRRVATGWTPIILIEARAHVHRRCPRSTRRRSRRRRPQPSPRPASARRTARGILVREPHLVASAHAVRGDVGLDHILARLRAPRRRTR